MKTLFISLFIIGCIIYSSTPNIKFKPFEISFETPYIPFAILFLSISIMLFKAKAIKDTKKSLFEDFYIEGYKDGLNEAKDIIEQIKKAPK